MGIPLVRILVCDHEPVTVERLLDDFDHMARPASIRLGRKENLQLPINNRTFRGSGLWHRSSSRFLELPEGNGECRSVISIVSLLNIWSRVVGSRQELTISIQRVPFDELVRVKLLFLAYCDDFALGVED